MKTVTQKRLIAALEHLDRHRTKRYGEIDRIVRSIATYHFRSKSHEIFEKTIPPHEIDRVSLEFQFAGIPPTRQQIKAITAKWDKSIDRTHRLRDRIYKIQEHHGISGLTAETVTLGTGQGIEYPWIEYPWHDYRLKLLPSDLEILRSHRVRVSEYFFQRSQDAGYQIWQEGDDGTWHKVSPADVRSTVFHHGDWCHVWNTDDGNFNLQSGIGLEPEKIDCAIWFVSSSGILPPLM